MFNRLTAAEKTITITIDGEAVAVPDHETVAASMLVHEFRAFRSTAVSGAPRAPCCLMGVCFECLVEIDGVPDQQACMIRVRDGMQIRRG